MSHALAARRCSPSDLSTAALSFASRRDRASQVDWIGLAYPLATEVIEEGCARWKHGDADALTLAFLNGRLLDPRVVEKIGRAGSPLSYLEATARNFVHNAQREAGARVANDVDVESLADAGPDDEGDEPADESADDEQAEARAASRAALLGAVAGLPARDRILLVASYAGADLLSAADRRHIASKRGVAPSVVDQEISAETARCEKLRQRLSATLERVQERLDRACERNERAYRTHQLVPSPEHEREVTRRNLVVQRLWARRDELRARLADPFCGSPNRRAIARLIGEVPPGGNVDTATNSAWTRARRLASALAKRAGR